MSGRVTQDLWSPFALRLPLAPGDADKTDDIVMPPHPKVLTGLSFPVKDEDFFSGFFRAELEK